MSHITRKLRNRAPVLAFALAFGLATGLPLHAVAQAGGEKSVATVNGIEITEQELALAEVELLEQFSQVPAEQRRAAILNALIDIKVLAQAAEEQALDEDPGFKARMSITRDRALHNAYFQSNVLETITDEEIKDRYDSEITNYPVEPEIKARHILVETEEAAKEIIAELDAGADFIELAKTKSTGPSGPNGGDLGYFGKGRMVPEFEEAAFALDKEAYTKEPVKSQFGWHVIYKEDERDSVPPTLEQVGDQVRQALAREKYFKLTQEAREKYPIEITDADLKSQIDQLQ